MYIELNGESFSDLKYISSGIFYPLSGFMHYDEYKSVVDVMKLLNGDIWTMPITLEIKDFDSYKVGSCVDLVYNSQRVGSIYIEDKFKINEKEIFKVFGTSDLDHPGVKKERERSPWRVGGKVTLDEKYKSNVLYKGYIAEIFKGENSIKTIAGFQTRNPIHRAHEYLQRVALETCDALFINPLIGWKKKGDFTEEAVMGAYETMIREFYPKNRVHLRGLKTRMYYAGPREAIFHAIIRRNLGCTHFIIGRDHAGVGNYYGIYEAQELAKRIIEYKNLGITLLFFREPYYCKVCKQIVTEKNCKHYECSRVSISGTAIRECLQNGKIPDDMMMRREIAEAIIGLGRDNIFIKG